MPNILDELFEEFKKEQDVSVFESKGYEVFVRNIISNKIMYIGTNPKWKEQVDLTNHSWVATLGSGVTKYDVYENNKITLECYTNINVYKSNKHIEIVHEDFEVFVPNEHVHSVAHILNGYNNSLNNPERICYVLMTKFDNENESRIDNVFKSYPSFDNIYSSYKQDFMEQLNIHELREEGIVRVNSLSCTVYIGQSKFISN
jgi:hypothetical protein